MRAPRLILASIFALVAWPIGTQAQIADRAELVAALDSAARAHAARPTIAGVSVAVVRGSDTLLMRGYGQVDLEWNVPTPRDASASYEIGSVTKQFTAAAILRLVEQGKLDLDVDFTTYLPDYDTRGHVVPLRRLLDHTSGIQGFTEMSGLEWLWPQTLPRDTLAALVAAEPFLFEPGTAQIYNNSAYFLLGLIIEQASGQGYEDFIGEQFFEPLGMAHSSYCSATAVTPGKAHGYDFRVRDSTLILKGHQNHNWPFAAGSLCSSAGDLVRWIQALHGGEVLSPASYRAMTTPVPLTDGTPLDYAMGLIVSSGGGTPFIGHGGAINGFLAETRYYPEEQLTVVVLQNAAAPPGPSTLANALAASLFGPVPAPVAVPYGGDLDALVGEYEGASRGGHLHLGITRDGDQLVVTRRGAGDGQRPLHVGDGVWRVGGTRYTFDVVGGRAIELMQWDGAARYRLRKIR